MIILNFFTEKKYKQLEPILIKKRILTEVGKIFTRPYRDILKFHVEPYLIEQKYFHIFIYPETECELAHLLTEKADFTLTDISSWKTQAVAYRWENFSNFGNCVICSEMRYFDFFKIIRNSRIYRNEILINGLFEEDIIKIRSSNIWKNIIYPLFNLRSSIIQTVNSWNAPAFNTIFYPFSKDNFETVFINKMVQYIYDTIKHVEERNGNIIGSHTQIIRTFIEKNNISIESFKKRDVFSNILLDIFRGNVNALHFEEIDL